MSVVSLDALRKFVGSWESYIDDILTSGHVSTAAIFDLRGRLLASTAEFSYTLDTHVALVNRVKNPRVAYREGIVVDGTWYKVRLADGVGGVMGKNRDGTGCSIAKTGRLLVMATHDHTMNADKCNEVVMCLYDYFKQKDL